MKELINKETNILFDDAKPDVKWQYADLILLMVRNIPRNDPIDLVEMESRLSIIKVCEAAKKAKKPKDKTPIVMKFENADFEVLKTISKKYKWVFIHDDVVAMGREIRDKK